MLMTLTIIGIIALIFGILVFIAPNTLKSWSKAMDKVLIILDEKLETYRVSIGIIAIAVGISALFLAYYIRLKYGG